MKAKRRCSLPPRVACMVIPCFVFLLTSCAKQGSITWALGAIHQYRNTAEMSGFNQTNRMAEIVSALHTEEGIGAIASAYQKTKDDAFKERLLVICWHLTFHTTQSERGELAAFLQGILKSETKPKLRNWALTDLAYCGLPNLEGFHRKMLKTNDPALWLRGAWGLWKIKSKLSVDDLIDQVRVRRTNSDFVIEVKQFVSDDSNQWTTPVLQALNAK
ncbi:MAG: hypothetical protein ACREFE_03655 [Limisphaerales bacterium]